MSAIEMNTAKTMASKSEVVGFSGVGDDLPFFMKDGADEKLASLRRELEVYVKLLNSNPREILDKTMTTLNPYCLHPAEVGEEVAKLIGDWWNAEPTKRKVWEFLFKKEHSGKLHKVNGKIDNWSAGGFGSRWADTIINGRNCRIAFYSKKHDPENFRGERSEKYSYMLVIDPS